MRNLEASVLRTESHSPGIFVFCNIVTLSIALNWLSLAGAYARPVLRSLAWYRGFDRIAGSLYKSESLVSLLDGFSR